MHRIKAILFDIDDTLYDLSIPFKEAFREFFPGEEMDLEGAFLASRKYSDRIYDRSLSGEISMEEMYIYRLGNAFRDYGKIIDGATALQFQSVYEKRQHEIRMTGEMERMLEELSRKMTLGIITNGPSEHQRDKVRALGVERWIPMERIWISGDLGVGKTVFTQGFASGLGITEPVNSPTFTIVQQYEEGRLPLYHFDVYRIGDVEEMDEIGYEDCFYGEGVCLIEWSTLIQEILPEDAIHITIEKDLEKGFDYRRIQMEREKV